MIRIVLMIHCFFIYHKALANIEEMVRNNLSQDQNMAQDESAANAIPGYSKNESLEAAQRISNQDEASLKAEANQKFLGSKNDPNDTGSNIAVDLMEKKTLDGFEDLILFQRAENVWMDPVSAANSLGLADCKARVNDNQNQYTKRIVKEKQFNEILEEKTCEKAVSNIVCEKTLSIECEEGKKSGFDFTDLSKINVASDMKFIYEAPYLTIGTIGYYVSFHYHYCVPYQRKTIFSIQDLNSIEEFRIIEIAHSDFMQIKVNDKQVYNGPYGGNKLTKHGRVFGDWCRGIVDTGNGLYNCIINKKFDFKVDIDIKPYLKQGVNVVETLVIVGAGGGNARIKIRAVQPSTTKFIDKWSKRCWAE